MHDLRFALRTIVGRPWFSAAIVVTLALGIGINTTVFTLVNPVLFKPLPFPNGDRLVTVAGTRAADGDRNFNISYLDLQDLRAQTSSFEGLEGAAIEDVVLSETAVPPERFRVGRISSGFFRLVRTNAVLGRTFNAADTLPNAPGVVLLSDDVWRNRYRGAADVVGRPVRINDTAATIVGVMPPGFNFPNREQLWLALSPNENELTKRDARNLLVIAVPKLGITAEQAGSDLSAAAARLAATYPTTNENVGTRVLTFNDRFNGGEIRIVFLLMLAAVGFVLLITCANVANMMLSRAVSRRREMAVRAALGASRWRLIRQMLVESVLLSLTGGLLGLGIATIGVDAFSTAVADTGKPSWILFTIDYTVLAYCAGVCVGAGLIFGIAPALRSSRITLNSTLKQGGRSGSGHGGRLSATLVVFQFALAVVLLAGAGLLIRSFLSSQQVNDWVPRESILTARVILPSERYADTQARLRLFEDLQARLTTIPAVTHASLVSNVPGQGGNMQRLELEGATVDTPASRDSAFTVVASPGYLESIALPLVRGRDFDDRDGLEGREGAIVTAQFADRFWPGRDPVGLRFRFNQDSTPGPWLTVVGMTRELMQGQNSTAAEPVVFIPMRQADPQSMMVVVRTTGAATTLADPLRTTMQALDSQLPLADVRSLEELLARARWPYRVFGTAFALFAATALLMAGVGLYAVMAQDTQRRTREIGIRVAMGATPMRVLRTVMTRGIVQLGVGLVLGLALAWATTGTMQALLFGVSPTDPVVLATSTVALIVVGLVACGLPAWRAAILVPVRALNREER